jgi:ubiquitin-like-conjugating enzyme ATG10
MSSDSWEFVSQEPHPQTGFPSYFLHPCQTAARMKLLRQDQEQNGDDDNPKYLWAWMSMIFPAVGHSIPPTFYQTVHDTLCGI